LVVSLPGFFFVYPRLIHLFPAYAQYFLPVSILFLVGAFILVGVIAITAKKKLGVKTVQWKTLVLSYSDTFLLSCLSWVFFGLGNYLVATSLHFLTPAYILQFIAFFVLAWFVGYISIITPMGLGIREGMMVLGLSPFAPLQVASLIAVFSRVTLMVAEVIFLSISYVLYKNHQSKKFWNYLHKHLSLVLVWSGILSYTLYFSTLSILKYLNFNMGKYDLGNMDQTVWNTLHGRIFSLTNPESTQTISRVAIHADYILVLLSPLYLIWSDPRTLLLAQTVVLSLGALFVYKLANNVLKNKTLAVVFAFGFLLNPLVQRQNLYDFHAVIFVTPLLIAAWYFLTQNKVKSMFLVLILAMLTKENIYLITALFGLYMLIKRKYISGALLSVASLTIFFVLMKKVIPDAHGGKHFALEYLSDFGDSTIQVAVNVLIHPLKTINTFFDHSGLEYFKKLLLPMGFLPLAAPLYMIFAGPDLLKNILSSNANLRDITYQYNAEIIPFLFIASIYAANFLIKRFRISPTLAKYYILFFTLLGVWQYGAMPGSRTAQLAPFTHPLPYAAGIHTFLSTIPESASVSATNNLASNLSEREHIYIVPQGVTSADYVLFLNVDWYENLKLLNKNVEEMKHNSQYQLVSETHDFHAFKRVSTR
jgi:uncharacterized membrane protein